MRPTRPALVVLAAAAFAACSDPPPVGGGSGAPAAVAPGTSPAPGTAVGNPTAAPAGKLVAGVGYDPAFDPLVNTNQMLEMYDAAKATEDDWLHVTIDGNPRTTNPIMASSRYEFILNGFIHGSPYTFYKDLKWAINPDITEKMDISPDRKVWTLTLKPGLTWHDGHPLTAHDIVFSYERIMSPQVVTVQRSGTDELASVEALDDRTVRYVHKDPLPTSQWNVLFSTLPKHIYEKDLEKNPDLKSGDYYSRVNREGIGFGPYRLVEWRENDKIVLERWDAYPGPKPHFKRVILRIVPERQVQMLTFEKGQLDEMELSAKQFADESVRSEPFKAVGLKARGVEWGYSYIAWNLRYAPLSDVRVRRALTMACNIPLMLRTLYYNLTSQCHGIFHPDSWMFNPDVKLLPYDLDAAAKLLDEAGWKVSDKDGWREKDGKRLTFCLLIPQGNPTTLEISAIFQQDLKSIGVEMTTQMIEWAVFQEKTRKHDFQASIASWGTGVDPDTNWNIWHTEMIDEEGGRNYSCYSNKRVDELFALARREFDETKRRDYYREIQKLIYDDQPYTFLWNRPTLWAFNRRIRGVQFSPRGVWNFDPSYSAWWVGKGDQAHGLR